MHENKKCAKCTRSFWCVENIAEYCQGFKVLFEWLISSEKKLLDCELNTRQFIVTSIVIQIRGLTVRDFSVIFLELLKFYSV